MDITSITPELPAVADVRAMFAAKPERLAVLEQVTAALYANYCFATGGRAFNGDDLPDWPVFAADPTRRIQANAWLMVGLAAYRIVETEVTRVMQAVGENMTVEPATPHG